MLLPLTALSTVSFASEGDESADPQGGTEVVVEARQEAPSASSRTLDRAAVEAMPARSADDLLRAMPGLHQSAHGGHGKAYQYFLRGFDAVHGADLAVDLDGVPVNEVSNVHAHGYLDLHFVPPVLVRQVELRPGSASVEAGDFGVAGSASFHLGLDQPGGLVAIGGGTDRSGEATLAWRPARSDPGTFVVADADLGQGIGMSRAWRQLRGGAGVAGSLGGTRARAWLLAYDGVFESPGALRQDDLLAGTVDFLDAYPGSGGGHSTRVLASAQLTGGAHARAWQATTWAGWRALSLQQNFTGWYDDPVHGDGSRQTYDAFTTGLSGRGWWSLAPGASLSVGSTVRLDLVAQQELAVEVDGTAWEERAALSARQGSGAAWASVELEPLPGLVIEPGLRGEVFVVDTDDDALAWAPVLAPKLRSRLELSNAVTGFLAYGRGYRSPDARGAGDGGRAPLAIADSVEVGATVDPSTWLALRGAGFATLVSDEIVFDHVAARYLATGRTRRVGVDAGASLRPLPGLRADLDLTWSDGRYVSTGEPIPYAPRVLVVGGLYAERLALGATTLTGGLRSWVLGPRPLPGGFHSRAAAVVDLTSTLQWRAWGVSVEVDNLLGARWRDGEFVYPSHWDRDAPRAELPVRHFTAGAPRAARLSLSRSF